MEKVIGIKVSDLKIGEIYACRLSNRPVLIIETESKTVTDADGKESTIPSVKAGKIALVHDTNGEIRYILIELHDGQLRKLKTEQ